MTNNSQISYRTFLWQLVVRVLIPGRRKKYFTLSKRPDWLWGQTSLLFKKYKRFFLRGQSGQGRKLTTHLHLLLSFRMSGAKSLLLLCAFKACKRTTLPSESAPMLEGYLMFTVYKCLSWTFRLLSLTGGHLHQPQLEDMPWHGDKRSTCHGIHTFKYSENPTSSALWEQCAWTINCKTVK